MTARLSTTEAADADILDIASYLEVESPQAATRFETEIWDAFRLIAEQPAIGRGHDGLASPLRSIRVSPRFWRYLVFYRQLDDRSVEVVRVLHGARDIASLIASLV